jgi:protocatechuate 3,4-dioxygenase beta subunit
LLYLEERQLINASRRIFLGGLVAGTANLVPASSGQAANAYDDMGENICLLTPQAEEGPFYLDPKLVRIDITEDRGGTPLDLRLRVIESGPCRPLAGARVDIWHCDAQGLYSGYPDQSDGHNIDESGQTFLRGTQMTDNAGWVRFETIYPGWYDGRTTHIHFKVYLDQKNVLTGQMFFPDALSEFLYTKVQAYGGRPVERSVVNANDHVVRRDDPGRNGFCAIQEQDDRYLATLTLGVDRNAAPSNLRPGPPPDHDDFGLNQSKIMKRDRFDRLERDAGVRPPWPPPPMSAADRLAALVPGPRRKS